MPTPFENFVNTELPKRIGTNESPITPDEGDIPVFTGVGLLTESKTASEAGLATEEFATNAANTAETNAKSYADDLVTSIYKFQTTYNPQTTGNFPTTANTVGEVAIKKGFTWVVSGVTGQYTFQGVTVDNGDTLLALVDNASATSAADWHITESNLGYTPENQNNKATSLELPNDTKYPTTQAVATALANYATVANQRYQFLNDSTTTLTTYTVPASAITENGRTIIELSNNSLTSITINAATGTSKVAGDSVNISITGTYAAQVLEADGVTLQGDLTFSYQHQTKTLVYKGSTVWKVVG